MQILEVHQLAQVAGGKGASGGKFPSQGGLGSGSISGSASGSVSSDNRSTVNINITCDQRQGRISYKESWGGLVKELNCESNAASEAARARPEPASSAASGAGQSFGGPLRAYFWEEQNIG